MRYILCYLLISLSFTTHAQDLLSGGWTTSNALKTTLITATSTATPRVYRIDCQGIVNDGETFQVQIIVDGTALPNYLVEGSYVVVEGRNIVLKQISTGVTKVRGTWKVIQRPEISIEKLLWTAYPPLNREQLVTSFITAQEFVVSINLTTIGCSNSSMTVYIDGNAVKDAAGNVVIFSEGSSVYGSGKSVSIKVTGTCTGFNAVMGDCKIIR